MTDAIVVTLCLMAAMSAECIPLLLILTAAAGVLTLWKEIRNARAATNNTDIMGWK